MERENIFGIMVKFMMEIGKKINYMDMELIFGKTLNIKVNIFKAKNTDMEFIIFPIINNIKELGNKDSKNAQLKKIIKILKFNKK